MRKPNRKLEIALGCLAATPALGLLSFNSTASAFPVTIANVENGGAGTYTIDNAEVVSILDSNASSLYTTEILEDSSGSIIDFRMPRSSYVPTLGDSIDITTTNSPFDGAPELSGTPTSISVNSSGNPIPTPPVLSLAAFNSAITPPTVDAIVTLDNVTFTGGAPATLAFNTDYTLTDSTTNTAILYDYKSYTAVNAELAQLNALGGGNAPPLDITGYVDDFNGVTNLYPISAVVVPEPASISVMAIGAFAMMARRRKPQA
jgi:hypothetical protein